MSLLLPVTGQLQQTTLSVSLSLLTSPGFFQLGVSSLVFTPATLADSWHDLPHRNPLSPQLFSFHAPVSISMSFTFHSSKLSRVEDRHSA